MPARLARIPVGFHLAPAPLQRREVTVAVDMFERLATPCRPGALRGGAGADDRSCAISSYSCNRCYLYGNGGFDDAVRIVEEN